MKGISTRVPWSRRQFDRRARVGLTCVVLSCGFAASASPQPVDGAWAGTTSQGRVYNFTVKGGGTIINPLKIGFSGTGISGTITFLSDIAISGNSFSASGGSCPYTTTNGTFNSATTANGTVTFKFTYSPYTCPASGTFSATWTATKVAEADLAITKTGPGVLTPPTGVTWRITVTNNGPSDATGVQVTDTTPTGLSFVSNSGSCVSAFPCSLGTIPVGETRTIDASYSVPAEYAGPNPVSNTATVTTTSADPNTANNSATATTQVVPPGPASNFFTVTPCRLLDTRDPTGDYGGPALVAGQDRTFVAIGSKCGIPATAKAVSVNLTVTEATAQGNLRLYPAGLPLPLASTVNYLPGINRANNAIVPLNSSGEFAIRCTQASGTAHAIVDVNGYFE